jgi:hypothetical protein
VSHNERYTSRDNAIDLSADFGVEKMVPYHIESSLLFFVSLISKTPDLPLIGLLFDHIVIMRGKPDELCMDGRSVTPGPRQSNTRYTDS